MKGLLGRDALGEGESLWIKPCNSIHTIGMKFPIDVVFLDQSEKVVHINHRLPANRITGVYFKAASVLELPVGVLKDTGTEVGDTIHFY